MPIAITTISTCSVRCGYCPQPVFAKAYKGEPIMSMDTFIECLKKIPNNVDVSYGGFAEPWGNKNATDMVVESAKKHRTNVFTTLKGMSVEDAKRIANIPFRIFCIHLPDKTMNIELTEEYFKVLKICMSFKNIGTSLWGKTDGRVISITGRKTHASINGGYSRGGNVKNAGRQINLTGPVSCGNFVGVPRVSMLLPDGTVTLCCMDYQMKHILGNLKTQNYESLFIGEGAKVVEDGFRGKQRILCHSCEIAKRRVL